MRPLSSLRGQLLLVVGLALLPLVALLLVTRARLAERAQAEWSEDAMRIAETAAAAHVETLRRTEWLLEALARASAAAEPGPETCDSLFSDFYEPDGYYTAFGIAGLDGITVCTIPGQAPLDLSERDYFREALRNRRTTFSDYHVGHITGRPVVTVGTPVFGPDSTVVSVLAGGIDLGRLDPLPEGMPLPPGAHISLIDADGRVLYHAPDSMTPGERMPAEILALTVATRDTVAFVDLPEAAPRTFASTPVDVPDRDVGARILVSFDPGFVSRRVDELTRSSFLGLGLAAVLLVLGVWGAVEVLILRRIVPMVRAAERLGRGELGARSGVGEGRDEIARLARAFDRMATNLQAARDAEEKRAQRQVAASEERLELLAETIDEFFWIWDPAEGRYLYLSSAFDTMWGFPREAFLEDPGVWAESLHPDDRERLTKRLLDTGTLPEGEHEYRIVRPDGTVRWIASRTFAVRSEDGTVERYLGVAQDVTERKELEETLLQSTKLEAVGRLAGGVAHDFNNILTAIQAHALFMGDTLPTEHPARVELDEILTGVHRAAGLTRQLLTFSRKQEVRPEVLDLNEVVQSTAAMIGRLIGEDVELVLDLQEEIPAVEADLNQMEQVLLNLVVNARDAMPHGGRVVIETRRKLLVRAEAVTADLVEAGEYVVLRVRDSGRGIDPDVLDHVFEPFFTTKPPGEGTGLGLATVYGIVKQGGGAIGVRTEEGEGTTFSVYLPATARGVTGASKPPSKTASGPGALDVLLVEDEEAVRSVMIRMLERLGCTVTAAADGAAALALVENGYSPEVLVTDIVMPGMNGVELVRRLGNIRADLPVVFMSGYPGYDLDRDVLDGERPFLQKPFTVEELAAALTSATGNDG